MVKSKYFSNRYNYRTANKSKKSEKSRYITAILAAAVMTAICSSMVPVNALASTNAAYSAQAAAAANAAHDAKMAEAASVASTVNPQTLKDLFNPKFYALQYPDAVAEAGNDPEALYQHFLTKGILNGYLPNAYFDIKKYRDAHPEYEATLGNNWDMWVSTFFTGTNAPSSLKNTFDAVFYAASNPEVAAQCSNDPEALYQHYISTGLANGLAGNPYFNLALYRNAHSELNTVYGNNWDSWLKDFYNAGIYGGGHSDYQRNDYFKSIQVSDQSSSKHTPTYSELKAKSDVVSDDNGNVLVPVDKIGEYLTLEELKAKCGDNLVLVTNKNGQVTFVGGHFTDVTVSNADDSIKAIDCMLDLIGLTDGCVLMYSNTINDSIGNVYYQFGEYNQDNDNVNIRSTVSLGVDEKGSVISLSSACGESVSDFNIAPIVKTDEEIAETLKARGCTLIPGTEQTLYYSGFNTYGKLFYSKNKDGYFVKNLCVADGSVFDLGTFSEIPDEDNEAYAFDFLFNDDIKTIQHTFTDYFGNDVTLDVACVNDGEKDSYYLIDRERHIAGNLKDNLDKSKFNSGFDSLDSIHDYYISSFVTLQKTYDYYKNLGLFENHDSVKPIIIKFDEADTEDNASCGFFGEYYDININNNKGNASFDGISHEFGHGVLYSIAPSSHFFDDCSLHEGYADISGNIIEMIHFLAGDKTTGTNVDTETWKIEESVNNAIRSMGDPESINGASVIGGINYSLTQSDMRNSHDHATIYGNICYRMNKELGIPLDDLLSIWYDALPNVTPNSTFKDVQSYIKYSTMLHGYEDVAEDVYDLFTDANVDNYTDDWKEQIPAENCAVYIPAVIDDYEKVLTAFPDINNFDLYLYTSNEKPVLPDKYGNMGYIIKDGTDEPSYVSLKIMYKDNKYNHYITIPNPGTQGHINALDILSAVYTDAGAPDDVSGLTSIQYTVDTDDKCVYSIARIGEENENEYIPIFIDLTRSESHNPLSILGDSEYNIYRYDSDNNETLIGTFNTADFGDVEKASITIKTDAESETGVSLIIDYGTEASTTDGENTENTNTENSVNADSENGDNSDSGENVNTDSENGDNSDSDENVNTDSENGDNSDSGENVNADSEDDANNTAQTIAAKNSNVNSGDDTQTDSDAENTNVADDKSNVSNDAQNDSNVNNGEADAQDDSNSSNDEADAQDDSNASNSEADAQDDSDSSNDEADAQDDSDASNSEADTQNDSDSSNDEADAQDDSDASNSEADAQDDSDSSNDEADVQDDSDSSNDETDAQDDSDSSNDEADAQDDTDVN